MEGVEEEQRGTGRASRWRWRGWQYGMSARTGGRISAARAELIAPSSDPPAPSSSSISDGSQMSAGPLFFGLKIYFRMDTCQKLASASRALAMCSF
jgi:hypothetical protein